MKYIFKILILVFACFNQLLADTGLPKEYYKLSGDSAKKYFFNYFKNRIEAENNKILHERRFIISLNRTINLDTSLGTYKKLKELQEKYKVKNIYDYNQYLERIDIIPTSLALAQAVTESGWGKSRFFKEANNIFGHWTYNPKIGMIPLRRPAGQKHFIRIFPNLQASISAYMRNLNRTAAYSDFRKKRKKMRESENIINGLSLSDTMNKYSGIGHDYVKILRSIIKTNDLVSLDKKFQSNLNKTYLIPINTN